METLQADDQMANNGTLEIIPLEQPLTLFVWSKSRVMPVRLTEFSVTEEAFDPSLNPIRAKVSLGLRVLTVDDLGFSHPGGRMFMTYLGNKEQLAAQASSAATQRARHLGAVMTTYPLQALIALGALPPVTFPTDSRYYGSSTLEYTDAGRPDDLLSRTPLRAAAGRPELRDGRAARRDAGRPSRSHRRQVSRRPAHLLGDLRRQRRHAARLIWSRHRARCC